MKVIHKLVFPLEQVGGLLKVPLPVDADVLSFGNQGEKLCLWYRTALPEKGVTLDTREESFFVVLTGESFPDDVAAKDFVSTVIFDRGNYILHVFRRPL